MKTLTRHAAVALLGLSSLAHAAFPDEPIIDDKARSGGNLAAQMPVWARAVQDSGTKLD